MGNCSGATNTAQGLWQAYQALVTLNQPGALNAILLFTDGVPTAVTETFTIQNPGSTCSDKTTPRQGAVYCVNCSSSTHPSGIYQFVANTPPGTDLNLITNNSNCYFRSTASNVYRDVVNAPATDDWGNSLTTTGYRGGLSYSGSGLNMSDGQTIEHGATNAADHAALRIRRGDPAAGGRSLAGVVIYTIGYGADSDQILLKRIANDPELSPNPVAAGAQGRYEYAGDPTQLNDAFTRVASEVLRLAQ